MIHYLKIAAAQQQKGWVYNGTIWKWKVVINTTTGRSWMDKNLGAERVATSYDDASAFGDLFQWGRLDDGHQERTSDTTSSTSSTDDPGHDDFITTTSSTNYDWRWPQNDDLWQTPDLDNIPAPTGWRLPTESEWDAEIATWGSGDERVAAYNSVLKLTIAEARQYTGTLTTENEGYYWSMTTSGNYSRAIRIRSTAAVWYTYGRSIGASVRLIKDE